MKHKNILFVCTGNTCRSVIAEYLFKKMLGEAAVEDESGKLKKIDVSSAGIAPVPGMSTAPGTLKVLREEKIDASGHRARKLAPELVRSSAIIAGMEKRHVEEIRLMPASAGKKVIHVSGFSSACGHVSDVPDPFGHSIEMYRECMETIRKYLWGLLAKLREDDI